MISKRTINITVRLIGIALIWVTTWAYGNYRERKGVSGFLVRKVATEDTFTALAGMDQLKADLRVLTRMLVERDEEIAMYQKSEKERLDKAWMDAVGTGGTVVIKDNLFFDNPEPTPTAGPQK